MQNGKEISEIEKRCKNTRYIRESNVRKIREMERKEVNLKEKECIFNDHSETTKNLFNNSGLLRLNKSSIANLN